MITWNCNQGLNSKINEITKHTPDLMIVQECANIHKLDIENWTIKPSSYLWEGDNQNKGIGVFGFNGLNISQLPFEPNNNKWFIPFEMEGKLNAKAIAVWAMNHRGNEVINKIKPSYRTLQHLLNRDEIYSFIIGDFNNNVIWDKPRALGNFLDIIAFLTEKKLLSCYHSHFNEDFGKETTPTLFWRKSRNKFYHIDYCFALEDLIKQITSLCIKNPDEWLEYSDHMPLLIDFNLRQENSK